MDYPNFTPMRPKLGLIGHRGIAAHAPENTLRSFRLAAEQGIDWIEFDIRLTKDHQLIIFHDDTLERTTTGTGAIENCLAADLMSLDVEGEPIPCLEDILDQLLALNLYLNIELKVSATFAHENLAIFSQQLVKILKNTWPADRPLPLISSFHWPLLMQIREQIMDVPLGFLHSKCTSKLIHEVARTANAAVHTHFSSLQPSHFALGQKLDVPILAYTVNDPVIAQQLFDLGVFALFSDDPLALIHAGVHLP